MFERVNMYILEVYCELIKWDIYQKFWQFFYLQNEKNILQFFGILSDQTPAWQQNCLTWGFLPANNTWCVFVYTKSRRLSNYWINFSNQPAVLLVSTGHIWSVFVISWLLIDTIVQTGGPQTAAEQDYLGEQPQSVCIELLIIKTT